MVHGFNVKEGATLRAGMRVEVYYNIIAGGFSVVSLDSAYPEQRGKVIAYSDFVTLRDAQFCINENKLQRILDINRKTVYAVVRGVFVGAEAQAVAGHRRGYCNPFKTGAFVDWETGATLHDASEVYFYDKFFSYRG